MDYAAIFIPLIAVIAFSGLMAVIYKDKNKVDKGFKLNFFRLSHRRRMKRSLIIMPFAIAGFLAIYTFSLIPLDVLITLLLFSVVVFSFEITYNYRMWKRTEKGDNTFSENGN